MSGDIVIKYECEKCNNLICDTSVCPVCHERTYVSESIVYYCENCKTPLYDEICPLCGEKGTYIGTDIRPVFPEERLLIEVLLDKPFEFAGKSVWCTSSSSYFVDGKKIKLSLKETALKSDADLIRKKIIENKEKNLKYEENFYNEQYIQNFINANKIRLNNIITEAHDFIRSVKEGYDFDSMFISFSGGKDSTVTSDLVMNALSAPQIIHLYGDTTLEYPETGEYLEEFKKYYPSTPLLVAKNKDQNFNDLCKVVGPPSRMMRWCCTIFKTGSITRKIEATFKDKIRILSFQGLRRSDFDVWLYIISKGIPFNPAYRKGFSRVGCWCCPNNGYWSEFLSHIYMNDEYTTFHNILIDFAKQVGKPDPEEYVSSGGWKARQGGNGLAAAKTVKLQFTNCTSEEHSKIYKLFKPYDDELINMFTPFGKVAKDLGQKLLQETIILDANSNVPILSLQPFMQDGYEHAVKVKTLNVENHDELQRLAGYQIRKFNACRRCLKCESLCRTGAISIIGDSYYIDPEKCVHCYKCMNAKYLAGGCMMDKYLRTK